LSLLSSMGMISLHFQRLMEYRLYVMGGERIKAAVPTQCMWLAYPYGEGRVVVTSMFEDWGNSHGQSTIQGRSIIRDLITWAKNPDLEILEYNLRNNPDPEVKLNIELKNLSDKTASEAKILWLDPDRNLYFEEETPISIPPGEETTIPVSHSFSGITDKNLGIWHTDYILYDSEGDEIQPQGHKVMR